MLAIHLFHDDKFVDSAIDLFESDEQTKHTYFLIVPEVHYKRKYVRSKVVQNLFIKENDDIVLFIQNLTDEEVQVVYVHALDSLKRKIVDCLPDHIVVVWLLWGYDFYNTWPVLQHKMYEFHTYKFLYGRRKAKPFVKEKLKTSVLAYRLYLTLLRSKLFQSSRIFQTLENTYGSYFKTIQKVDIIVPVVQHEMKWIKRMKIPLRYAPFRYVYLEQLFGGGYSQLPMTTGGNILVGNSANPTSNHFDIFIKLSKLKLGNKKVYVPLSYGGSKEYIDFVLAKGRLLLGDNFHPLQDFMSLERYNQILNSCGSVVFNHVRQQAVGNMVALGFFGCKMYLNKKSPVYSYFKSYGLNINSIDSLNQKNLDTCLSDRERMTNRFIIEQMYKKEEVLLEVKILTSLVEKEIKQK